MSTDDEITDFRSAMEFSSGGHLSPFFVFPILDDEAAQGRTNTAVRAKMKGIYDKAILEAESRVGLLLQEAKRGNWKALRSDNPIVRTFFPLFNALPL